MKKQRVRKSVLNWFDGHYEESRGECERLIIEAEVHGMFTQDQLKEFCLRIPRMKLSEHLRIAVELSCLGYSVDGAVNITYKDSFF